MSSTQYRVAPPNSRTRPSQEIRCYATATTAAAPQAASTPSIGPPTRRYLGSTASMTDSMKALTPTLDRQASTRLTSLKETSAIAGRSPVLRPSLRSQKDSRKSSSITASAITVSMDSNSTSSESPRLSLSTTSSLCRRSTSQSSLVSESTVLSGVHSMRKPLPSSTAPTKTWSEEMHPTRSTSSRVPQTRSTSTLTLPRMLCLTSSKERATRMP